MNKPRVTAIEDRIYGCYLWEGPNGKYLADEDGNYLLVFCPNKFDIAYMAKARKNIAQAAASMGFEDGKPIWKPGLRPLTDEEHDYMMERLLDGKTPDPADEYLDTVERLQKEQGK